MGLNLPDVSVRSSCSSRRLLDFRQDKWSFPCFKARHKFAFILDMFCLKEERGLLIVLFFVTLTGRTNGKLCSGIRRC